MGKNIDTSEIFYKLFYWKKNNKYVFSRTKFITILSVLVCFINYLQYFGIIHSFLNGIILSIPIFIIGFLIHKFMNIDSSFYNDSLSENIKHFLFYWYDGANKFKLSKTKVITIILIIISLILGQIYGYNHNIVAGAPYGLIFAILVFLIGYIVHISKLKDKKENSFSNHDNSKNNEIKMNIVSETKLHINKSDIPPKFSDYVLKVKEMKKEFDEKELKVKELITTKFNPPQITYTRFMSVVDNCSKIFNQHYNAVFNIINFGNDDSAKIENEINAKIDILQSFIDKLDDLSNELVINMSKSNTEDVDNALNDMENLISSINSYED